MTITLVSVIMTAQAQTKRLRHIPKFEIAVALIKKYEGWHGAKHYPYVGYGHKIQKGESYTHRMTKHQADALLRSDLRKLCATFRSFGRDSLILATLAYNVGRGRLLGNGKDMQSRLIRKLKAGNRNIYHDYISFRCWNVFVKREQSKLVCSAERRKRRLKANGRKVPSIERRRKNGILATL